MCKNDPGEKKNQMETISHQLKETTNCRNYEGACMDEMGPRCNSWPMTSH